VIYMRDIQIKERIILKQFALRNSPCREATDSYVELKQQIYQYHLINQPTEFPNLTP